MNLKEAMTAKGASAMQLNSKTVEMIETIMAEDAGVVSETANEYAKNLQVEMIKTRKAVAGLEAVLASMNTKVNSMKSDVANITDAVDNFVDTNKQKVVEDPRTKDAILAYQQMLTITQSIFGKENMTEAVIVKAIEAGSYGFWRSVMGGKFEDDSTYIQPKAGRRRL